MYKTNSFCFYNQNLLKRIERKCESYEDLSHQIIRRCVTHGVMPIFFGFAHQRCVVNVFKIFNSHVRNAVKTVIEIRILIPLFMCINFQ
jgi:hypothetical protein